MSRDLSGEIIELRQIEAQSIRMAAAAAANNPYPMEAQSLGVIAHAILALAAGQRLTRLTNVIEIDLS
jgi:hypothetical protein